jgi:hypothetical protein
LQITLAFVASITPPFVALASPMSLPATHAGTRGKPKGS